MTRRRVKITGLGPVTAAGIGREAFFKGINEPVSRAREITRFDPKAGQFIAAEITNFKVSDWVPQNGGVKKLPRQTQFAMAGAMLALADAGIAIADLKGMDPVVISGSASMDPALAMRTIGGVATKGPRAALPSVIFDAPPSAVGTRIAGLLETRCRTTALQSACCSGIDAIGFGADMIASGQAEIVLCCGTEAPIYYQPMLELTIAKLSPRNSRRPAEMGRPFDLWRNTGVIGEGACVIVLEPEASPRPAYAWIAGYAFSNDDDGQAGSGLGEAMKMALANGRRRPAEVDFINAWGPGHQQIDRAEAEALCEIFGPRISRIPAVSLKGAIGNPFAAAGAIQVASTALSLKTGRIPPTVNWQTPDPECPLNLSAESRDIGCQVAIVNAHGVSGTNTTIVMLRS
jgi:3-oxoacyl-(acyl-carrier-protein) synthase